MSLADARCTALQVQSLSAAGDIQAAGTISGDSVNADVAAARILVLSSNDGNDGSIVSALVPGLTAAGVVMVQQQYNGNVIPVQAEVSAVEGGFAVTITAAADWTVETNYWVYIVRY